MSKVLTGLECFIESVPKKLHGARFGLLSNPASVNRHFCHARVLIDKGFPGQLTRLYSPQHGFYSEKQDNMVESRDAIDPVLGIPVLSLYGKTRQPTREMLEPIDVLIIDLQDVGTRVYTFVYTISYCMEAAKQFGKKVIVLDRPNPINGVTVEGNCLSSEFASFVGRYSIPMRHGLTVGELARLFNEHCGIGCELDVVPMKGWDRRMLFSDTGLSWVAPSPNLPTPTSAMVYPGQVIWEGTNVSEGRGTTLPFELFGAPFINVKKINEAIRGFSLPGVVFRETGFEPTSNKWQGRFCHGFQIHVTDPDRYQPYRTTLELLRAVWQHHQEHFQWKSPPYEYEHHRLPIDLILGDQDIRRRIERGDTIDSIAASWQKDLDAFIETRQAYRLY
jgi:uncharacterized protein YbbC (DUF1343 family)